MRQSTRTGSMVAMVVTGVAMAVPAAEAATTCKTLKGSVVRSTPSLKVVSQSTTNGKRYLGCAKPNGAVRTLGTKAIDENSGVSTTFAVVKTAGTYVLLATGYDEGPGAFSGDRRSVIDIKTGKKRTIWDFTLAEGECSEVGGTPPGRPKQFALGANGIVAGVFVGGDCTQPGTQVIAFVPGRAAKVLDTGPNGTIAATSLRLEGRTVRWKHGGEDRSGSV